MERGPAQGEFLKHGRHRRHAAKLVQERVLQQLAANGDAGDFDRVVDVGDDGDALLRDQFESPADLAGVAVGQQKLIREPIRRRAGFRAQGLDNVVGDFDRLPKVPVRFRFGHFVNLLAESNGDALAMPAIDDERPQALLQRGRLDIRLFQAEPASQQSEQAALQKRPLLRDENPSVDFDLPIVRPGPRCAYVGNSTTRSWLWMAVCSRDMRDRPESRWKGCPRNAPP